MLATAILESVKAAIENGELPAELSSNRAINEITLERPKNRDHGDYATSIALALAKGAGKAPRQIAEIIANSLRSSEIIERIEIAGPGFINITLVKASQGAVVNSIFAQGEKYGEVKILSGVKINLEFDAKDKILLLKSAPAIAIALSKNMLSKGPSVTNIGSS
ncbi:MAG: hypothetical protein EBV95_06685 [Actinobacteria bacterium]|nr:hypothetical protein [Actinomycetota bacterium]